MTPSRCERCGTEFGCGAGSGSCWCMEVGVSDAARAALAESYSRCLCPDCLRELSRRPDPGRASAAGEPQRSAPAGGP